ncbi:MAG: hypothetical protein AAF755_01945 [Pseudomonadota bacterium]
MKRLFGACVRAVLVATLVMTPALIVPGAHMDAAQLAVLFAFLAAAVTFAEYYSDSPSVIAFRDTQLVNRVRFVTLAVMLFGVAHLLNAGIAAQQSSIFLSQSETSASIAAKLLTPAHKLTEILAESHPDLTPQSIVDAARFAFFVSLLASFSFGFHIYRQQLPCFMTFNIWINLPLFDPSDPRNQHRRLRRRAVLNIAVGLLLPFFIPFFLITGGNVLGWRGEMSLQTLIWIICGWAFLPASMLIRGTALYHVTVMMGLAQKQRVAAGKAGLQAV